MYTQIYRQENHPSLNYNRNYQWREREREIEQTNNKKEEMKENTYGEIMKNEEEEEETRKNY